MKRWIGIVSKLLGKYRQLLIGIVAGAIIFVPSLLYMQEKQKAKTSVKPAQQTEVASVKSEADNKPPATTDPLTQTPTQDSTTPSNQPRTSQAQTANNATPPPVVTPTPVPTQPDPTTLTTCVYQNGSQAGQNCPYNPPPSWSTLSLYTCFNQSDMFVPCQSYRDTVSIEGINIVEKYTTPTNFCVFTFSNGTYKATRVGVSNGDFDCSWFPALDYDPIINN